MEDLHMPHSPPRRRFLKLAALSLLGGCRGSAEFARKSPPSGLGLTRAKVVVVGGGFAGAALARYLHRLAPRVAITLVEPRRRYFPAPGSQWPLAGIPGPHPGGRDYAALHKAGIQVIEDTVTEARIAERDVLTAGGRALPYDRLVLAPGTRADHAAAPWNPPENVSPAWRPPFTELSRRLSDLSAGARVALLVPPSPFSGPASPYERAGLIAYYLKIRGIDAGVTLLDFNPEFCNQEEFFRGWRALHGYPQAGGRLERHVLSETVNIRREKAGFIVETPDNSLYADLLEIIPPQRAASLAENLGLTDASGWCPVHPLSFESRLQPGIHVIGDACRAGEMGKTAFAANAQAKVCAAALAAMFQGQTPADPIWLEAGYSLLAPEYGISRVNVYYLDPQGMIREIPEPGNGITGTRPHPRHEAVYARSAYLNLIQDTYCCDL